MHYYAVRRCPRPKPVLARLACLIHAANVHSEPGSNPSKICLTDKLAKHCWPAIPVDYKQNCGLIPVRRSGQRTANSQSVSQNSQDSHSQPCCQRSSNHLVISPAWYPAICERRSVQALRLMSTSLARIFFLLSEPRFFRFHFTAFHSPFRSSACQIPVQISLLWPHLFTAELPKCLIPRSPSFMAPAAMIAPIPVRGSWKLRTSRPRD